MKSVGLSDEVYERLLHTKHSYEKREERVISFDEVISKLIALNGNYQERKGEKEDEGGEEIKQS